MTRRVVQRLSLFADIVPADAVVALARVDREELAKLIGSGALTTTAGGFRIAPDARALATALPPNAAEAKEDAVHHG